MVGSRSLPAGLALAGAAALGAARWHRRSWPVVAAVVLAAAVSGSLAAERQRATVEAELPQGRVTLAGVAADDPVVDGGEASFTFRPSHRQIGERWQTWAGPRLLVSGPEAGIAAGERVLAVGTVTPASFHTRSGVVAGRLTARSVERLGPAADPLFAAGNLLRRRVLHGLADYEDRPAAALLLGFLIGEVDDLPDADAEALRLAGLSHFVAVSGSNVALFLAAWWLASGPLGWGPRRRALLGLVGLAVFVVVTRWEPSVVRAATMAALVLGGRMVGVALDGWTALGGAVTLLLVVSGDLAGEPGFQLSAAATAGVLAGSGLFGGRRPRWAWTALAATASAQAAVAPLLLLHFGTIPLFAPLTNVVSAPLVAFSTSAGGIGVLTGFAPLTAAGLVAAEAVLGVARFGEDLPQLGWAMVLVVAAAGGLALLPRLRPLVALSGVIAIGAATVLPARSVTRPEAVFLDVGQGDAVLLRGPAGEVVLIDGGPDPVRLRRSLRVRGIERIDLLVVTHGHADHTDGLAGLVGWTAVRRVWHSDDGSGPLVALLEEMRAAGVVIEAPAPGWRAEVGSFHIEVLGPRRRYASLNDGSLVLAVQAAGVSLLLPGDIETVAQADLGPVGADVLKVPHQGAVTSDLDWLVACAPRVAIISVGPNQFGHPAPEVLAALAGVGATVHRTDLEGDVTIVLGPG